MESLIWFEVLFLRLVKLNRVQHFRVRGNIMVSFPGTLFKRKERQTDFDFKSFGSQLQGFLLSKRYKSPGSTSSKELPIVLALLVIPPIQMCELALGF